MKEDSERWRKKADWLGNLEPKKQDTDETPGFVLFCFVSDIPDEVLEKLASGKCQQVQKGKSSKKTFLFLAKGWERGCLTKYNF